MLHDLVASVVLAMPYDFLECFLVQAQVEWRFVLPHLISHVVAPAQLVGEALTVGIEHQATDATQRLNFACKSAEAGLCVGSTAVQALQTLWYCNKVLDPAGQFKATGVPVFASFIISDFVSCWTGYFPTATKWTTHPNEYMSLLVEAFLLVIPPISSGAIHLKLPPNT